MKLFRSVYLVMILSIFLTCQNNPDAANTSENKAKTNTDTLDRKIEAEYIGIYTKGVDYQEFKDCGSWQVDELSENNSRLASQYDSLNIAQGEPVFVRFNGKVDKDTEESALPHMRISEVLEAARFQGQSLCQPPKEKVFTFRGNEPFWSLTISSDSIVFNHFEQNPQVFPYSAPQWQDSVWVYKTEKGNQSLIARISEGECYDSMSGMRYAMRAEVQTSIGTFDGCGAWEGRKRLDEQR